MGTNITLPLTQPWSGTSVCNQTLRWWPSDSEESYCRMTQDPTHREYFARYEWDKPDGITYRFNSLGFRGDEPDWSRVSLFTFGCSFTMGIGLAEHQTWPWLVGRMLDLQVVNFALGGVSGDWCFRLAEWWIAQQRPHLAVMLAPPHERLELVVDDQGTAHTYTAHEQVTDEFLKRWFSYQDNQRLNNIKNRLAFIGLGKTLGVSTLAYDAFDWFAKSREEVGYARDYLHAGPQGHQLLANQIVKDWNEIKHA